MSLVTCSTCQTLYDSGGNGYVSCPNCVRNKHLEQQTNELKKQTNLQKEMLVNQRLANAQPPQPIIRQLSCPSCSIVIRSDSGNCPSCGIPVLPVIAQEHASIIAKVIKTFIATLVFFSLFIITRNIMGFSTPWYINWLILVIIGYFSYLKFRYKPVHRLVNMNTMSTES